MATVLNDQLKDKLAKILRLTTSPVEGEAKNATALFHKLLRQHNLSLQEIEDHVNADKGSNKIGHFVYTKQKKRNAWKNRLLAVICKHNMCAALNFRKGPGNIIVGEEHNIAAVVYLFEYLSKAIDRLWSQEVRKRFAPGTPGWGKWARDYCEAFVSGIDQRLGELDREDDSQTRAMVLVKDAAVKSYVEDKLKPSGEEKYRDRKLSLDAYMAGKEGARQVPLHKALAATTTAGTSLPE